MPLLYGKRNFIFILGGIALIALGMLLMAGGSMPSPDVWDESIIYGFRRITLAPISILLGLAVVLYSIFAPANNNV
jgi:sulfite exporter TauE/SafE